MIKKTLFILLFIISIFNITAQNAGDSLLNNTVKIEDNKKVLVASNDTSFQSLYGKEQIKDSTLDQRIASIYMYGLKNMKRGDRVSIIESVKSFRQCILLDSTHSASYFQIGTILLKNKEYDKGVNAFMLAYEYSPDNAFYKYTIASLLSRSPKTVKDALPLLEDLHTTYPDKLDYLYSLMNTYNRLGRKKDCLKIVDDLEEQEGYSQQVGLIRLQVLDGSPRHKIIKEWERLINHYPLDSSYKLELSNYYFDLDNEKRGQMWLDKALVLHPKDGNVLLAESERLKEKNASDSIVESYILLALKDTNLDPKKRIQSYRSYVVNHLEDKSLVMASFESMQKRYPEDAELVSFYVEYLKKQQDTVALIPALENLITMNESQSNYYSLMDLYQSKNDTLKLSNLIQKARIKFDDPTWDLVYVQFLMMDSSSASLALETIDSLLSNDPIKSTKVFCYRLRANYYQLKKEYVLAQFDYEALISLNPKDYMNLNNYAYMLTSMPDKDIKYAYRLSQSSVNAEPSNPSFLDTYAWINYLKKDYKTAWFYIQRAISYAPNEETIKYHYTVIQSYIEAQK